MAQQTAVEWLKNRLPSLFEHDHDDFYKRIFEQAKKMEKEQIVQAYQDDKFHCSYYGGVKYYNETFGNEGV